MFRCFAIWTSYYLDEFVRMVQNQGFLKKKNLGIYSKHFLVCKYIGFAQFEPKSVQSSSLFLSQNTYMFHDLVHKFLIHNSKM